MIELISVARTFNLRPSSMLHGLSTYEAYCFDVACTVYVMEMEKGRNRLETWAMLPHGYSKVERGM